MTSAHFDRIVDFTYEVENEGIRLNIVGGLRFIGVI